MKNPLQLMFLISVALLAACAPAASAPQADPGGSTIAGSEESMYPPQDLALIASTGRPQFLHSYADWCITCKQNHPIINEMQRAYGEQVDFIHLNIDVPETLDARTRFDLVDRSRYIFVDSDGNVLQRWFGLLDQATVETYIRDYLANVSA